MCIRDVWKTYVGWWGLIEYLRGEGSWGAMERAGFGTDDTEEDDSGLDGTDTVEPDGGGVLRQADRSDGSLWGEDGDGRSTRDEDQ